ncbi:phosphatidylethanolamine N-methyltransferase [Marasmius tenuissimus]|uniref:Phosphatidylethanolamine N-methyltransferase n=1 Tax=Marasmius tenuissimus TaxID=585030 RepID=A0ABR2ZA79_9AGAR
MSSAQSELRRRRPESSTIPPLPSADDLKPKDDVVWGKTPSGQVFIVPVTHDVLTLFHPQYPKSHFDILNLALLGSQILIFFYLPRHYAQLFFLFYFAFWRAAYDAGLGYVLTKQSKKKWIVRQVQSRGWLDEKRRPKVREWIRRQLVGKMGKDYSFDELPLEYNTWLLFRQAVDVILLNDFVSYCMFAFASFRVPDGLSGFVHVMRWLTGILMIVFNLWVKTEAHDVVKDYGWYWGDCFFQRGNLVFDGVFELAPHPMYSVGYAGYYGLSLIAGSYKVLFVSLAAHAAQFGFLVWFENPHIERNYIKPKAIAKRTPIHLPAQVTSDEESESEAEPEPVPVQQLPTPSATETETEETVTETEAEAEAENDITKPTTVTKTKTKTKTKPKPKALSHHDLFNKYFRRDTLILNNIDLFRATDFLFVLILAYLAFFTLSPIARTSPILHFTHTVAWTLFHCFGLGLVLKAQSEDRWLVKRFLRNYHYEERFTRYQGCKVGDGGMEGAKSDAWGNWKVVYNVSLVMMNISFLSLVYHTYTLPPSASWTVGHSLLRHTLGLLLIGLHIWASLESYQVLGVFGWFFGDFFMSMVDFPTHLEYSGIYRYLNNPEMTGGAAWFGFSLIVWGSHPRSPLSYAPKLVLGLAIIRHLAHLWFLRAVENPHMKKLYGDAVRDGADAGFVKVLRKNVVGLRNKEEVRRMTREVQRVLEREEVKKLQKVVSGTVGKVVEESKDVVEEFLRRSRPKIEEVVQDTKVLLLQSRERLVITRISNDLSSYDTSKYKINVMPSSQPSSSASSHSPQTKFPLGQPIQIKFRAPSYRSRKDWIGIYRVGANKSTLVTSVSSRGMWVGVTGEEEWDGDIFVGGEGEGKEKKNGDDKEGVVTFSGDRLPWTAGVYEARYHHDGKYNVMSVVGPFEVVVEKPTELTYESIRSALERTIPLCLDSDPALIPMSCGGNGSSEETDSDRDPDDFSFWSEKQAKRICGAIRQMFGVEYAVEVVVADANLGALAKRILAERRM